MRKNNDDNKAHDEHIHDTAMIFMHHQLIEWYQQSEGKNEHR